MSFIKNLTGGNKFLPLIAVLILMGLLSTDIFLPSLPQMTEYFKTTPAETVKGLSYYFITLAASFLFVGNLVDRYGRRTMLLVGLMTYIAASLSIAVAGTVTFFVASRMVQGFSSAIINTTARTIGRATTEPSQMGKVFSFIGMVVSISPMVAPLLGGFIEKYLFWQVSFYFLAAFAGLVFLYAFFRLPETAPHKNRQERQLEKTLSGEMKAYWLILSHLGFLSYGAILVGFFFFFGSYIGSSSFIYTQLGVAPEQFGVIFTLTAVMFLLGSASNNMLQDRIGPYNIMMIGIVLSTFGGVLLWALARAGIFHIASVMVPMMIATLGNGLAIGNAFAGSIKYFRMRAGTANALQGFLQYGAMASAVTIMGQRLQSGGGLAAVVALGELMMVGFVIIWCGLLGVSLIKAYRLRLQQF
ncbi:MAG: multidrug effflux MFS transporter [Alphaproteobacteria bacterium]|nr:multidrug effflux MFS transporter [Alphaproteobacteria bacterium]